MNKHKSTKDVHTSTPVVKNVGNSPINRILNHAFPPSSIDSVSDDESYFVKRPKVVSKKSKRTTNQSFQRENSGKKMKLSETISKTNNNSETTSSRNMENVFIEKMHEKIKAILNTYPEIAKADDTRNSLKKSLGKHQTLSKENILSAMKHHENISSLQEKINEERKMFDKCIEAVNNENSNFVNKSKNLIQLFNTFEDNVGEIQSKIKNAGEILSRKLWNEFIENYAKTMNQRILSLME